MMIFIFEPQTEKCEHQYFFQSQLSINIVICNGTCIIIIIISSSSSSSCYSNYALVLRNSFDETVNTSCNSLFLKM